METVYIETTIVSYLVAKPPARTLAHQWHIWTQDWWRLRRPHFECVASVEVLREAAAGDLDASRRRMEALSSLTLILKTREVDELSAALLAAGPLPSKAKADAVHLAMATVYPVEYLLIWNCRHLANAEILTRLRPVVEQHGYHLPIVCTPIQLMGTIDYED